MLGVTRYKVTHYCNSTTFRGNEHVTKYFFKSSNAVTITEIEISSLLALLSFVNNEHLETRRQDRPTLAASDLTSQDRGGKQIHQSNQSMSIKPHHGRQCG